MIKIFIFLIFSFSNIHSAIFIAGYNSLSNPCLWITDSFGTKIKTVTLDKGDGIAWAVLQHNAQLFIVGYSLEKPCLWITNLFGTEQQQIFLSQDPGNCSNLALYGNNLYLVGTKNKQATLWIYNIASASYTSRSLDKGINANNLTIAKNQLYIIGRTPKKISGKESSHTLWITDLAGNVLDTVYNVGIGSGNSGISNYENACYILSFTGIKPFGFYLTKVDLQGKILDEVLFQSNNTDLSSENIIIYGATSYMLTQKGIYTTPLSLINSTPYNLTLPIPASTRWYYFIKNIDNYYIAGEDSLNRASLFIYDRTGNLLRQEPLDEEGSFASNLTTPSLRACLLNFSPIKFQRGFY
jgi:hypothetical protein